MDKMSLQTRIFEIAYTILYNLVAVFEWFFNLWVYLKRKFVDFCHEYRINNDFEYILKNSQKLDKIPTHLTVLLGTEEPSHQDLSNLVVWSCASGISFISFYDYKGILKKTEAKFQEEVKKKIPAGCHVIWHDGENSYKNGITGRKIHIRTLSDTDGYKGVVDVTKQLCSYKSNKINQHSLDRILKDIYVFPDPDLGLYCGKVFNLYGYPPWQIRVTEFLNIGSHHSIGPHTFVNTLFRYSKTEQRLGK